MQKEQVIKPINRIIMELFKCLNQRKDRSGNSGSGGQHKKTCLGKISFDLRYHDLRS